MGTPEKVVPHRARVIAFLEDRPGMWCSRCIADATGIRTNTLQRVVTLLEGTPGYRRSVALCTNCGKNRLTVQTTDGARG